MSDPRRETLRSELAALNAAVDAAIAERRRWMDTHMADFADYQPGDVLYELDNGRVLGTVKELYRYHADDPRFDRSMHVEYRFADGDNTSRHGRGGQWYGTRDQVARRYRALADEYGAEDPPA